MKHDQNIQAKQTIGFAGEYLTAKFLKNRGFTILDKNHRRPWGELDIVAQKDGVIHFIEVKATSGKPSRYGYMPEDHVGGWKKQRLSRIIRTYLIEKKVDENTEFQVDVMVVFLDFSRKVAIMRLVESILLV